MHAQLATQGIFIRGDDAAARRQLAYAFGFSREGPAPPAALPGADADASDAALPCYAACRVFRRDTTKRPSVNLPLRA